jgi:uncharacterized membrane protein
MRESSLIIASIGAVLWQGALAALAWVRLPVGARLPVHWDANGVANGFADAGFALSMPAIVTALVSLLFVIIPRIEPLQNRLSGSAPLLATAWGALLALMVALEILVAAPAFSLALSSTLIVAGVGLMLIVIGNALPKSRPGFFVGIRTPWALTDTDNWIATHRLGSRTMIMAGAAIVVAASLPIGGTLRAIIVCLAVVWAVVPPFLLSYLLWRRRRGGIAGSGEASR